MNNTPPFLSTLSFSTLNVHLFKSSSENDEWIPVEDSEKFKAHLNNIKIVIMPKTGHIPMEERPKESVAIALDFLSN